MIHDTKLIRILILPIFVSITGISCAPYEYDKTPQRKIGLYQGVAIYTSDDKGSIKRDIQAEHIRDLSCSNDDGTMDCGRPFGW